jgi:DNA transformation protein
MSDLTELPNIGKTLAKKLYRLGVSNREQLAALGSVEAIIRISHATDSGCYNMLYALEGAIQGVRWHSLPGQVRREFKNHLDAVRKR